ncbi:hypothetical protein P5V15_004249 [Pogonomyrmex californicus]
MTKTKRDKPRRESADSALSSSSGEESDRPKARVTRMARKYQVAEVTRGEARNGLELITLLIKEVKKGKATFLLDTGATLILIKIENFKSETPVHEKRIALTGVTGHKIHTLGKVKLTIKLGKEEIRHSVYVVRDDFFMDYEGILGIDFLAKQKARCDHGKKILSIGKTNLKLQYQKVLLKPHSETIIEAFANRNQVGIIRQEQPKPGVFIGCWWTPRDSPVR